MEFVSIGLKINKKNYLLNSQNIFQVVFVSIVSLVRHLPQIKILKPHFRRLNSVGSLPQTFHENVAFGIISAFSRQFCYV